MFKSVEPDSRLVALREKIIRTIQSDCADIGPEQLVAMLSYTVGQVVAMCDQRKVTPDMMMKLVGTNLEAGNRDAVARSLGKTRGNA